MMQLIDSASVQNKLARLDLIIKLLNDFRKANKKEFEEDPKLNGSTMYNLVVGIEIIVDIGNHLLAKTADAQSKSYRDVIASLGTHNIIPQKFADLNMEMTGFRNRLIHDYDRVDLLKVYAYLQKAPDIFSQFLEHYHNFLEKQRLM